jgi:hypothetical protein
MTSEVVLTMYGNKQQSAGEFVAFDRMSLGCLIESTYEMISDLVFCCSQITTRQFSKRTGNKFADCLNDDCSSGLSVALGTRAICQCHN